jgi:DNA-binding NarL/FixJ family response regulator
VGGKNRVGNGAAEEAVTTERAVRDSVAVGLRVLVVDDHELVARSLVLALRAEGLAVRAATGDSAAEIVGDAASFLPTVVLLDLDLGPIGSGLDLIAALAELGSQVVIVSGTRDRHLLAECLERGAVNVIDKAAPFEGVLDALSRAVGAGPAMCPDRRHAFLAELWEWRAGRHALLAPFERLTGREQDVLMGLCDGRTAGEIAETGFVSIFTVRGHIRSILAKLDVGTQLAAVAKARAVGWPS